MPFMGAEGRYEDYIYLAMLEREWKRPDVNHDWLDGNPNRAAPLVSCCNRSSLLELFRDANRAPSAAWLQGGPLAVDRRHPEPVRRRRSSSRPALPRAFRHDLRARSRRRGSADIWAFIVGVQERRNAFAHGNPRSIDDATVLSVISNTTASFFCPASPRRGGDRGAASGAGDGKVGIGVTSRRGRGQWRVGWWQRSRRNVAQAARESARAALDRRAVGGKCRIRSAMTKA